MFHKITGLYPQFKTKAIVFSYDDGVEQDVKLVELLNKYGLRGTFNLNSQLMREQFVWKHECGMDIKRLPIEAVLGVYSGHEVASHSLTHPHMTGLTRSQLIHEMSGDKRALELIFKQPVVGFAIPFDSCDSVLNDLAPELGFEYVRISDESFSFSVDVDFYCWRPTVFHLDESFRQIIDDFLHTDEEPALCMVVGHSYDLDVYNLWHMADRLFARIAQADDVISMRAADCARYLTAMRQVRREGNMLVNPTAERLCMSIDGDPICLAPHGIYQI